jgi:hypothetical protein
MIELIHTIGLRTYLFETQKDFEKAVLLFSRFPEQNAFEAAMVEANIFYQYADR